MIMSSTHSSHPVVVAVDGSSESEAALRWAVSHADTQGRDLRVVTCYRHHFVNGESDGISWQRFESTKRLAAAQAQMVIRTVLGPRPVEHVLSLGPIEAVLIDHSRDASVIVLGTRSSTGIQGPPHQSTTDRITGRVNCPVVSISLADATSKQAVPA